MGYVPGANGVPAGSDPAFPGSSSSVADDNSLSGVSAALGTVPVAVHSKALPPPLSMLPSGLFPQNMTLSIKPINQAILDLDKLPKAQQATVQRALYQAGYFPSSYYGNSPPTIVPGEIDAATRSAYRAAVEDAARQSQYNDKNELVKPVTVDQVIHDRIANRQTQGVALGPPQQQTTLTNPDDIRAAVLAEAKAQYGHKADEGLINTIISRYQTLQSQAQQSTAPTVTNSPSVSSFAQAQVAAAHPGDVAANRALEVGNLFLNAFQAPAGNQPLYAGSSGG